MKPKIKIFKLICIHNEVKLNNYFTSISFNGIPRAAPAGLTCLKDVAAGRPVTSLSSLTNCQLLKASHKFMYPGEPLITKN